MAKTITDIIPPSRRRQMEQDGQLAPSQQSVPSYMPPASPTPPPQRPPSDYGSGRSSNRRRFPWGIALIALIVVVGSGGALLAFANAEVVITPTTNDTEVSGDFTATYNSGDLPYALITVDKTVSANVPAESTETVNDPSQGKIVISNAQETAQTLIKNTRFEAPDGKIFRIQDSVTIPGGSVSSPGTAQATVYADTGGEQYNLPPSSFTVPGLRGSASYDLVTAKSSEAFTGGFSGERASVAQATRDAQNETSKPELDKALQTAITAELNDGYIVLPGATFITYTPTNDTEGENKSVNVNLKGTAVAVAVPNTALAKAIALRTVGQYSGQQIRLDNPDDLKLVPSSQGIPTAEQGSFAFTLSGNANLIWDVDTDKIAGAVAGKDRTAAFNIIKSFPEVGNGILTVRPFWKSSFPDDPADISVSTTTAR